MFKMVLDAKLNIQRLVYHVSGVDLTAVCVCPLGSKSGLPGCQSRGKRVMDQCLEHSHHQGQEPHSGPGELNQQE